MKKKLVIFSITLLFSIIGSFVMVKAGGGIIDPPEDPTPSPYPISKTIAQGTTNGGSIYNLYYDDTSYFRVLGSGGSIQRQVRLSFDFDNQVVNTLKIVIIGELQFDYTVSGSNILENAWMQIWYTDGSNDFIRLDRNGATSLDETFDVDDSKTFDKISILVYEFTPEYGDEVIFDQIKVYNA